MSAHLIELLRSQADEIASCGHYGWGNTMLDAADALELAEAQPKKEQDAAVEALRKALCSLPRYSFLLNSGGGVSRVKDSSGLWIELDEAHKLFDPVAVDWLMSKSQPAAPAIPKPRVPEELLALIRMFRREVAHLQSLLDGAGLTQPAAPAVSDGYKLIAREATEQMVRAALRAPAYGHPETATASFPDQFAAAWDAAPEVKP